MSKEGTPELTKSWVFVDSNQDKELKDASGVQEVTENEPHGDSDTDSISVISESGCSYKTDEEELIQQEVPEEKDEETPEVIKEPVEEPEPEFVKEPEILEPVKPPSQENKGIEKLLYFATSAFCAIVLVGFSIAVQHYFQRTSELNTFEPDQRFVFSHVENVKNEPPSKLSPKRKSQLNLQKLENKIPKLQGDNEFHDKISPIGDNDLRVEENPKSNYKLNKNKNAASNCNKGNCDVSEKHSKMYTREKPKPAEIDKNSEKLLNQPLDENTNTDETYDKKIKELKVKEDYLKRKEKFLIEKEHDLLKKEIKLNKEKGKQQQPKHKHDKKVFHKKGKNFRENSSEEEESSERKDKLKYKEYPKKQTTKKNKKYVLKEERKQFPTQRRFKFSEEHIKKRNISGQWYTNLHEARDNMRQRKRASFKKNKAHWYFQWMVDRARLRVK